MRGRRQGRPVVSLCVSRPRALGGGYFRKSQLTWRATPTTGTQASRGERARRTEASLSHTPLPACPCHRPGEGLGPSSSMRSSMLESWGLASPSSPCPNVPSTGEPRPERSTAMDSGTVGSWCLPQCTTSLAWVLPIRSAIPTGPGEASLPRTEDRDPPRETERGRLLPWAWALR